MRAELSSRLGFLMLAAGCAVGLGNVWRFPFVVGRNGGAAFVIVYVLFLALLGFPMLVAELALGRASRQGVSGAMRELAAARHRKFWTGVGRVVFAGNFLLMIYYTDVAGWLVKYAGDYLRHGGGADFQELLASPGTCCAYLLLSVAFAGFTCCIGVQRGVERITKWMMVLLLLLLSVLAVKAFTLPGASEGLAFYLAPDWSRFMEHPWRALFDAMGQAFFTLSTGVGCMTIFGSYVDKKRTLATDAVWIIVIDLFVAFLAGLIIFPACFSFNTEVSSGPGLIFIALPKVFAGMSGGRMWGFVFFLFLSLAALTTVIAVFECLIGGLVDELRKPRLMVALGVSAAVGLLAAPTAIFEPVLGWEDFIFSQFWLPVGALFICIFVTRECGWGWGKFNAEVSVGEGMRFPSFFNPLMKWLLPTLIVAVLIAGLVSR